MVLRGFGLVACVMLLASGVHAEDGILPPFSWKTTLEMYIVVGRVTAVKEFQERTEYRVDVVREWRERVRAGQTITIVREEEFLSRTWRVGEAILFTAEPTDAVDTFEHKRFGADIVAASRRIVEQEVPLVVDALKEMRKVYEGPQDAETLRRKSQEMMKSSNFYIWCVGITMWGRNVQTREDLAVFERVYADEHTPLRKVVWIESLFLDVRRSYPLAGAARHVLLERYLRRRFAELPLLPEEREEEGRAGAATRPAGR